MKQVNGKEALINWQNTFLLVFKAK